MEDTGQDGTTKGHTQESASTVEGNFHIGTSVLRTTMCATPVNVRDTLRISASKGENLHTEEGPSLGTDVVDHNQVTAEVEAVDEAEGMAVVDTVAEEDVVVKDNHRQESGQSHKRTGREHSKRTLTQQDKMNTSSQPVTVRPLDYRCVTLMLRESV